MEEECTTETVEEEHIYPNAKCHAYDVRYIQRLLLSKSVTGNLPKCHSSADGLQYCHFGFSYQNCHPLHLAAPHGSNVSPATTL